MGKPLISDAAMRSMFDTMQRLRAVKRETRGLARAARAALEAQPEALPAAVLSQLNRRDVLVVQGAQPLWEAARTSWFPESGPALTRCDGSAEECAAVAAGLALRATGSVASKKLPVVVSVLEEFPALAGVLQLIESHSLSLLVIAQADAEPRAESNRRMAATKVPILPVDDSDAVAVCRVMQESVLRARQGWGGVVIHATRMPGAPDGIEGMRQRLERRGLL